MESVTLIQMSDKIFFGDEEEGLMLSYSFSKHEGQLGLGLFPRRYSPSSIKTNSYTVLPNTTNV